MSTIRFSVPSRRRVSLAREKSPAITPILKPAVRLFNFHSNLIPIKLIYNRIQVEQVNYSVKIRI